MIVIKYFNFNKLTMRKIYLLIALILSLNINSFSQNNALNHDGANDYALIPNTNTLNSQSLTVELWFKTEKEGFQFLTIKNSGWAIMINSDSKLFFSDSNNSNIISNQTVETNKWTHVAVTYNNSTKIANLYINGFLEVSKSDANMVLNNEGSINISNNGAALQGSIDEYRIWTDERTQEEINKYMYNTLSGSESNLGLYYDFNQGNTSADNTAITTLTDKSNNNIDATINNFELTGSASNFVESSLNSNNNVTATLSYNLPRTKGLDIGNLLINNYNNPFDGNTDISIVEINEIANGALPESTRNIEKSWFINGDIDAGNFELNITFSNLSFSTEQQQNPSLIKLYHRELATIGEWPKNYTATEVTSTTATFEGITSFGQFMIAECYPTISINKTTLDIGSSPVGNYSAEKNYSISGKNLTDDITITAPENFEISKTSGSAFSNKITLSATDRIVSNTTIYVRHTTDAEGYSNDKTIEHTSSFMTDVSLAVTAYGVKGANDWEQLTTTTTPSGRYGHRQAYIADGKVLLYGGFRNNSALSDTWLYTYETNSWTNLNPSTKPGNRWVHDMAYLGDDKVLFFGGYTAANGSNKNDTWIFDLSDNTWTNMSPASAPSTRRFHKMSYIADGKVLLFGGSWNKSDTWLYDINSNNWTQLSPTTSPSGRDSHGMSYIGDDKVMIYGGYSNKSDTWIFDLSDNTWVNQEPTNSPGGRYNTNIAYIGDDKVMIYGGANKKTGTYVYDLSDNTWLNDINSTDPVGSHLYGLASLSMDGTREILMFGGQSSTNGHSYETWIFGKGDYSNIEKFTEMPTDIANTSQGSTDWGDFDNDGDLDLLISGSGALRIYKNNGDHSFTDINAGLDGANKCESKWADFDNDGDLDLAVAKSGESIIYRNDGNSKFTNIEAGLAGLDYASMDWGDYDKDGDLDIVLIGKSSNSGKLKLYKNNGNGSFTHIETSLQGSFSGSVEFGDYDNDGYPDLLVTGLRNNSNSIANIYRNNGDGTFSDINAGLSSIYLGNATWGDYDNDGDLDILLAGSNNGTKKTRIYRNDNNSFSEIDTNMPDVYYGQVKWGDYNNDGNLDVLMMGRTDDITTTFVKIFSNSGNNKFSEVGTNFSPIYNGGVAWGDYDNDGDLDVITAAGGSMAGMSSTTKLYKNNIDRTNSKPSKPENLTTNFSNGVLNLKWDKSTDNSTPQNGLSYNISIGTSSGGTDIVAGHAETNTAASNNGYLRIADRGIAHTTAGFDLKHIPVGTLYCKVQAIDNSFVGSLFSEQSEITTKGIGGVVWGDSNANGIRDNDEQLISNVKIELYDVNETVLHSTVTDSEGKYSFSVADGDYYIKPELDLNYAPTLFTGASNQLLGSDLNSSTLKTDLVTFAGTSILHIDLGLKYKFTKTDIDISALMTSSISVADYDNDGDLDILHAGSNNSESKTILYKNDGNGVYSIASKEFIKLYGATTDWGDYDNDGDIDFVISGGFDDNGKQRDTTLIYENNNSSFSPIDAGFKPMKYGSSKWGDFDNDGDLDLLISGNYDYTKLYINNGDKTFTDSGNNYVGINNGDAEWVDFNNDGLLDFIITGWSKNNKGETYIYKNQGDGTFLDTNFDYENYFINRIEIADFNNDGYKDIIALASIGSEAYTLHYRNLEGAGFETVSNQFEPLLYGELKIFDYNNDGYIDILYSGNNKESKPESKFYQNENGSSFSKIEIGIDGVYMGAITPLDIDNDGDLDIAISGQGVNSVISAIYRNETNISNLAPETPTGFQSTYNNSTLILKWNSSTDTETAKGDIKYSVGIGTYDNSNSVRTMHTSESNTNSLPYDEYQLTDTSFTLNGFATYQMPQVHWSVQAIDNMGKTSTRSGSHMVFRSVKMPDLKNNTQLSGDSVLNWETDESKHIVGFHIEIDNYDTFTNPEVNDTIAYSQGAIVNSDGKVYFSIKLNELADYANLNDDVHYNWRVRPIYKMKWAQETPFSNETINFFFNSDNITSNSESGYPNSNEVSVSTTKMNWNAPSGKDVSGYKVSLYSSDDYFKTPIYNQESTNHGGYSLPELKYNTIYRVTVITEYSETADTFSAEYSWEFTTEQKPQYSLNGNILFNGNPLNNLFVNGEFSADGSFSHKAIHGETTTLTPQKENYRFEPVSLTYNNITDNVSNISFVAIDTLKPVLKVKDNITVELGTNGTAIVKAADIDNGSYDNNNFTLNIDRDTNYDCDSLGKRDIIFSIIDESNNKVESSVEINVVDIINPTAKTKDISINLDNSGIGTITAEDINNQSSDNCGIESISLDKSEFSISNIGQNLVKLTVTDISGNSSSSTAVVTVNDSNSPTVITKNIEVELNSLGTVTVLTTDIDNGSNDNDGIKSMSLDKTTFNCSNLGENSVTLTVRDNSGNTSSGNAKVTVVDRINPVVVTQNTTLVLDNSGKATLLVTDIDNGSSDNCAVESMSIDISNFSVSNIGQNLIKLTVTDKSGNSSNNTSIVTVVDNNSPIVITKDITVTLDNLGIADINTSDIDNGSSDNDGIKSMSLDKTTFDCSNLGENSVTLSVTDNSGNTSTGEAKVTIEDKINPTVVTRSISVVLNSSGKASIIASDINNGSSDNCVVESMTLDKTDFTNSDIGNNIVLLTVTDKSGNSSSSVAAVTVNDSNSPLVITKDITVELDNLGTASISTANIDNGSNDNDGIKNMSLDKTFFNCSDIGENTVTLTVTDNSGNISTAEAKVTVEDNTNPFFTTKNITIVLDNSGTISIVANDVTTGSLDNCGIETLVLDKSNFTTSDIGKNIVTITATDKSGNIFSSNAAVTVNDSNPPIVITKDITVELNSFGNTTISPLDIDNGSNDNDGIKELSLDIITFDCSNLGDNIVTLSVTDNSGNISTAEAKVTIEDKTNPITITKNTSLILDDKGEASLTAADINDESTDNCEIESISINISDFTVADIGQNLVNLTVTDKSGNSSSNTAVVTIIDNSSPTVLTKDLTVELNNAGTVSINATDIDNGSYDNDAIKNISLDKSTFDCSNLGVNSVTLSVTDNSGNTSTAVAKVTIEDKTNPIAITKNISISLNDSNNASLQASDINNESSDNCSIETMVIDKSSFTASNIGQNTVKLTVTDKSGNSSSSTAIVTVNDSNSPIVVTKNITLELNSSGIATASASDIDNGSNDNDGIKSLSLDKTSFDCSNIGDNTVTLSVIDNSANTSTAEAKITIEDNINPIVITKSASITLNNSGAATLLVSDIDNGSSDNCSIESIRLNKTDFNISNIGENIITLTVTDKSGNSSSNMAVVTVNDNISPTVITKNISVELDNSGSATISTSDIDNGSSDNHGIENISLDKTIFDCSNLGDNTITISVSDTSGNTSSAEAIVTILDKLNPVVITKNTSIVLNSGGTATLQVSDINNGSFDNCGIETITIDKSNFSISDIGQNLVNLTVTDKSGNRSTTSSIVTLYDSNYPTVITKNITVELNNFGVASISASDVDNGSNDNDGIKKISIDKTSFDCSNLGDNIVTLSVTDNSDNNSTAEAIVTIVDNTAPVIITQNTTITLDATDKATITVADINNGSSDNCDIKSTKLDKTNFSASDIGNNIIMLTATDYSGNSSSSMAVVTVIDNNSPTVITKDITVELDNIGSATISASDIDNGSIDNDGIKSITLDKTTFDCSNLGLNTVTVTVTDNSGNSAAGEAKVTIEDKTRPIVVTKNITIVLNNSGNASITSTEINNGSSDNCEIESMTLDKYDFLISDIGQNMVNLTVTDKSGNRSSNTAVVTVNDSSFPTVITKNITVELNNIGTATVSASDIDNGSSDNDGIKNMSLDITNFDCSNIGENSVTLSVTDNSGNKSTGVAKITVVDNTKPTVSVKNITVVLDSGGNATITATDINNGSSDNCEIESIVIDQTNFTTLDIGQNMVNLTVTDKSGNSSSSIAAVTVNDGNPPIVATKNITVELNNIGTISINTSDIDNGSNDDDGIKNMSLDKTSFDCSNIGNNTVRLTVTDNSGNISNGEANVTVVDNINPITITKNTSITLDSKGIATIQVSDINNESSDNCGIELMVISQSDFTVANIGQNLVNLTVTDKSGNSSGSTAVVTVVDNSPPTVVTNNITVLLNNSGIASINATDIDNGSYDNDAVKNIVLDKTTFDCSNLGDNTVTLSVTDNSENRATGEAKVTIVDNTNPVATTKNISIVLNNSGIATLQASDINYGSTDNCSIETMVIDKSSFTASNIGQNSVKLTVTDKSGNSSSSTAVVTVNDSSHPSVITKDITIELNSIGIATVSAADIDNGSTDNDGIKNRSLDKTTFDCTNIGDNTVTISVTDNSGNTSSAEAKVTVVDIINPIVITKSFSLVLDNSGSATLQVSDINNGSSDNCSIEQLNLDKSEFTISDIGENIITLTVTDKSGNSSSNMAVVTINDNISPIAITKDITVELDNFGSATIVASDVDNGSSDNHAIQNISLNNTTFDCSNLGENSVTLTVSDSSGNISTAEAKVTIVDRIDPIVITKNISIVLNSGGSALVLANDINNGSFDNCGIETITIDKSNFSISDIGQNLVNLTVTDKSGNSASNSAVVTVYDNSHPTVITKNITMELNNFGIATISASDVDNGSNDTEGIKIISLDKTTFDCSNLGDNIVTLSVTDNSDNTSTAEAKITIVDNTNPVIVTKNATLVLDNTGNISLTVGDINDGSSDNCAIESIELDKTDFTTSDIGENIIMLRATDKSGNSASSMAVVTIIDRNIPIVITKDITIELDNIGTATINTSDINNGSTDNHGVKNISLDKTTFDCSNLGDNRVTLSVTDHSGNISTGEAKVTVVDNTSPVVITKNITIVLDNSGIVSLETNDINNGSSDNCGIETIVLDKKTFTTSDIGKNIVTLTATDKSGNSSSSLAVVTVNDSNSPTVITKNITVALNNTGTATITASDVDNGSSDNDGIKSISLDKTTFDCSTIGVNRVTLTVTDNSGNSSTADAEVTIVDNTNPIVITKNITIVLDDNGTASIKASDINNGSSDNCAVESITIDKTEFTNSHIGNNIVTLTVSDKSGNSSSSLAVVTVNDSNSPTVITKNITVALNNTGTATITASDVNNGSSDNDGIKSISLDKTTFDCSNLGENSVTLSVTDNSGNTSTGEAKVTIEDKTSPIVITKNITIVLNNSGSASIQASDINNGSSDNCAVESMSIDKSEFTSSDIGENTIKMTVTDKYGNSDYETAIVTVVEKLKSFIVTKNITKELNDDGLVNISVDDIFDYYQGENSVVEKSIDKNSFDCSNIGKNSVTVTVEESNGNIITATATINIIDNSAPKAVAKNITIYLDDSSDTTIAAADIDNGSSDNCSISAISIDKSNFTLADVGQNVVKLTVSDNSNNSSYATAIVTVVKDVKSTLTTKDITLELGSNGVALLSADDIVLTYKGSSNIVRKSIDIETFECSKIGLNEVTLTVSEESGSTLTSKVNVTVSDNLAPTVITKSIEMILDDNGVATITADDIDNGSNDNCSIETRTIDKTTFDCSDTGLNSVILTVTDKSGNRSFKSANVTIIDNIAPAITCETDYTFIADNSGQVIINDNEVDPEVTESCTYQLTNDYNNGSTLNKTSFSLGTTVVTWSVADHSNNISTCKTNIHVQKGTDIDENDFLEIEVSAYPNPTDGIINLVIPEHLVGNDNNHFIIYNSNGVIIKRMEIVGTKTIINISNSNSGIYVLNVILDDKTITRKIIKR